MCGHLSAPARIFFRYQGQGVWPLDTRDNNVNNCYIGVSVWRACFVLENTLEKGSASSAYTADITAENVAAQQLVHHHQGVIATLSNTTK